MTEAELRERYAIVLENGRSLDPWIKQFDELEYVMRGNKGVLWCASKDGTGQLEVIPMAKNGLNVVAVWNDDSSIKVEFRNVKRSR